MFSANQLADWFISRTDIDSGDTLSHLKLQKLVYYSQAWHYTIYGEPIFEEPIQAWKRGPVIRSIYDRFNNVLPYNSVIRPDIEIERVDFPEKTLAILNDIENVYGEHSASYLEDLTHQEEPWIIARGGLPNYANCERAITLESMRTFYARRLNETQAQN